MATRADSTSPQVLKISLTCASVTLRVSLPTCTRRGASGSAARGGAAAWGGGRRGRGVEGRSVQAPGRRARGRHRVSSSSSSSRWRGCRARAPCPPPPAPCARPRRWRAACRRRASRRGSGAAAASARETATCTARGARGRCERAQGRGVRPWHALLRAPGTPWTRSRAPTRLGDLPPDGLRLPEERLPDERLPEEPLLPLREDERERLLPLALGLPLRAMPGRSCAPNATGRPAGARLGPRLRRAAGAGPLSRAGDLGPGRRGILVRGWVLVGESWLCVWAAAGPGVAACRRPPPPPPRPAASARRPACGPRGPLPWRAPAQRTRCLLKHRATGQRGVGCAQGRARAQGGGARGRSRQYRECVRAIPGECVRAIKHPRGRPSWRPAARRRTPRASETSPRRSGRIGRNPGTSPSRARC
jgi:hypothetical protein